MSELLTKDGNLVSIKFTIIYDDFKEAVDRAYKENRFKFSVAGFRKGKAPKKVIENRYGEGVFYEDALNAIFPTSFEKAAEELNLKVVSKPEIQNISDIEKGKDINLEVSFFVKPEFELGQYKDLGISMEEVEVSDEEIEKDIENKRKQNARMVAVSDRSIQNGDFVTFDFTGKIDGEKFEGGSAEGYTLEIGSNSFIPGFEEKMIGMNMEEEKDLELKFPEDYHEESLKGKDVIFTVKVHEIKVKELPEVDDEFVKDISEFDTLDELKADIRTKIFDRKKGDNKRKYQDDVRNKVLENTEIDLPKSMIDDETDDMLHEMEHNMLSQGISMEDYFAITGTTSEKVRSELAAEAEKRVKMALILEKVADAENIKITEEDFEEECKTASERYNMEYDKVKSLFSEKSIRERLDRELLLQKAWNTVCETKED